LKRSHKTDYIVSAAFGIGAFFFAYYYSRSVLYSLIVPLVIILIEIFSFFYEKYDDKKALKRSREYVPDSGKVVEYRADKSYELIHGDSMKDDMVYRYRTFRSIMLLLTAILFIAADILFHARMSLKLVIMLPFLALFCAGIGIYGAFALPVRKFYKEYAADIPVIEKSYMTGRIISDGHNFLNVGSSYTVMCSFAKIEAAVHNDLASAVMEEKRVKQTTDGIYSGSTYENYVVLTTKSGRRYELKLPETQAILAAEEITRAAEISKRL